MPTAQARSVSGELLNLSPSQCNITDITGDKLGRYSHTALISKGYS